MITINRTAIVVRPGQPFLDWLDVFDHWFEWSFHSVVVDLCDDPLPQEQI
jgi:hypothetical protein